MLKFLAFLIKRGISVLAGPSLLGDFLTVEVPGVVHHELEVSVIIDGHGDVIVVLNPLLHGNVTISSIGVTLHVSEVVLEGVEELSENLILGLLALLDIRVLLGIVSLSDVINVELTRLVNVHDVVDLLADVLSEGVHLTTDGSEELVIRDLTRAISVEDVVDLAALSIVHTDSEVMHGFDELSLVESLGSVIIGNLELSADRGNTSGSSLGKSFSQVVEEHFFSSVLGNGMVLGLLSSGGSEESTGSGALSSTLRGVLGSSSLGVLGGPTLGAHTLSGLLGKFPGVLDHELEVVVIIDGGRDVVVVLDELLLGDNVVGSSVVSHGMLSLEGLQELLKDLILSLLTRDNIGMSAGIVDTLDIFDVNPAVAISIESSISLHDNLLSSLVHGASNSSDELVVLEETGSIVVEVVEELLHLTLGEAEHEVTASLGELVFIKRSGVVVIHDLELSLETDEATGTSGGELLAHGLSKLLRGTLTTSGTAGSSHRSAIEGRGELFVVNGSRVILIINAEKSLEILNMLG